jgi:cytochrome b561
MNEKMSEIIKYGSTAKWLHWVIGVIVIIMLIFGRTLESLELAEREQIIMGHSGLGTLVLLLMIIRVAWHISHETPGPTQTMGEWQVRLSKLMQGSFYVLLILQPIFGILQAMYLLDYEVLAFGVIDYSGMAANDVDKARLFHICHSLNSVILSVLVIGHMGAALYHHFIQKDDVLRRMLPFGKVKARSESDEGQ